MRPETLASRDNGISMWPLFAWIPLVFCVVGVVMFANELSILSIVGRALAISGIFPAVRVLRYRSGIPPHLTDKVLYTWLNAAESSVVALVIAALSSGLRSDGRYEMLMALIIQSNATWILVRYKMPRNAGEQ
jgi:hypothetical protein